MIKKLSQSISVKGVRSFLGHTYIYRRFINDFSKIVKPLTYLLIKDVDFDFDKDYVDSFYRIKKVLMTAPIMQAPIGVFPLRSCVIQVIMSLELHWDRERTDRYTPSITQVKP